MGIKCYRCGEDCSTIYDLCHKCCIEFSKSDQWPIYCKLCIENLPDMADKIKEDWCNKIDERRL